MAPILYIVIPCYNEEQVLPVTAPMFLKKITDLSSAGKISENSRVLFVDDGSKDSTWEIISNLAKVDARYLGIRQSRNRGHQNAVLAGLMEAKDRCDITISIDCDGQDDIDAMDAMVEEFLNGCDIVYGVRSKRTTDTFFKRFTAESYYKLLKSMGVDAVYNHADYRLVSAKALAAFAEFKEVNLFLRIRTAQRISASTRSRPAGPVLSVTGWQSSAAAMWPSSRAHPATRCLTP